MGSREALALTIALVVAIALPSGVLVAWGVGLVGCQ